MASAVAELDALLTSMLELAPPGVSKSKISSIQQLCNANVQSESVLIQKVYTHFKKAPPNKKLGVLYVVDGVTRQWLEAAKKAGQVMGTSAADGTHAAGVNRVTELLPALMSDIIAVAPEDHKAKIKKLIDIWERGNIFPSNMVSSFKQKLNAPSSNAAHSTTPTGTPPQNAAPLTAGAPGAAPTQNTSAILANLQALAKQTNGGLAGAAGNPSSSSNVSFPQTAFPQQNAPFVNPVASMQPAFQAVGAPTPVNNGVFPYGSGPAPTPFQGQQQQQQQALNMGGMMPPQSNTAGMSDQLKQQLEILSMLKAQGIPQQDWPGLLAALMATANSAQAGNTGAMPAPTNVGTGNIDVSRDRNGYDRHARSPQGGRRERSRSRSPRGWDRRRDNSPHGRRRDSPVYGEYGGNRNSERGGDYDRRGGRGGGRGSSYRQRSPPRRRSPSPARQDHTLPPPGPKWVEYDHSLPKGHIKVYSRTLFVGGVTSKTNEDELQSIFAAFGRVQTCIVNGDKRHAFIKMISREEALQAKAGMEDFRHPDMQLRTRWGVGFGPRDCSDYQTGISVIPIERLTDADRKWMLNAEYGGSGGKPIEEGLCVEEPDIEIGAGVSSKAISRRMATDKSGTQGPRSTREPPPGGSSSGGGGGRFRQPDRRDGREGPPGGISSANSAPLGSGGPQGKSNNAGSPTDPAPTVPNFGFQFAGGMPMFPAGFAMPGQAQGQQQGPSGGN